MRWIACTLALLAGAARAEEGFRTLMSPCGRYSLELPAAWTEVEEATLRERELLRLLIDLPNPWGQRSLAVAVVHGMRGARARAVFERDYPGEGDVDVEAAFEPVPHVRLARGGDVRVTAFRMMKGRGIAIALDCKQEDWPGLAEPFFRAVQSLKSTATEWPETPPGYVRTERDGLFYDRHPDVTEKDEKEFHAFVRRQVKEYAAVHGKLPKWPELAPVICLHDVREKIGDLSPDAAKNGARTEVWEGRMFAALPGDDRKALAIVAHQLTALFHGQVYRSIEPAWVYSGEQQLAWERVWTGKDLPYLTPNSIDGIPTDPLLLEELLAIDFTKESEKLHDHALPYIVFFRMGPGKYRSAFSKYLDEVRETCDFKAATERHLLSLDQKDLRQDLRKTLRKLRPHLDVPK